MVKITNYTERERERILYPKQIQKKGGMGLIVTHSSLFLQSITGKEEVKLFSSSIGGAI